LISPKWDEIVNFFRQKPAHACGRFRPGQLKSYSITTPVKINPGLTLFKAGLLSLVFVLAGKQASAQTTTPKAKTEVVDKPEYQANKSAAAQTGKTLKGVVLSEDGEPMPGANVILKGSTIGTTADADGRFEFQEVKEGDVFVFQFIGFESREYTVPKNSSDRLEIRMTCDYQIMGELAVDAVYTKDQSRVRRLWQKVKAPF
jgi:hypothetical protein